MNDNIKTCFVIMPIGDMEGYDAGHFDRVYKHLIKPACEAAGLAPVRGDEVKATNYIAIDILQRILKSDIVVCDLSGKNPNVMYELGIRQAFDQPIVLIKDRRTDRVFDIQGLRTLDYLETLRVDSVLQDQESIREAITATLKMEDHEVNSLVSLLGVEKAKLGKTTEVSGETTVVLNAIEDISSRLGAIELRDSFQAISKRSTSSLKSIDRSSLTLQNGEKFDTGDSVYEGTDGKFKLIGTFEGSTSDTLILKSEEGRLFEIGFGESRIKRLTNIPI